MIRQVLRRILGNSQKVPKVWSGCRQGLAALPKNGPIMTDAAAVRKFESSNSVSGSHIRSRVNQEIIDSLHCASLNTTCIKTQAIKDADMKSEIFKLGGLGQRRSLSNKARSSQKNAVDELETKLKKSFKPIESPRLVSRALRRCLDEPEIQRVVDLMQNSVIKPDVEVNTELVKGYARVGSINKARKVYETVDDFEVHNQYAMVLIIGGHEREAILVCERLGQQMQARTAIRMIRFIYTDDKVPLLKKYLNHLRRFDESDYYEGFKNLIFYCGGRQLIREIVDLFKDLRVEELPDDDFILMLFSAIAEKKPMDTSFALALLEECEKFATDYTMRMILDILLPIWDTKRGDLDELWKKYPIHALELNTLSELNRLHHYHATNNTQDADKLSKTIVDVPCLVERLRKAANRSC